MIGGLLPAKPNAKKPQGTYWPLLMTAAGLRIACQRTIPKTFWRFGEPKGCGRMTNPQYTLTVALGVGADGLTRREMYEKAAGDKPLSQWVREALDKAAERELRK